MSQFDVILDSSQQNLKEVPPRILQMHKLKMLYLQQNFIKVLPKNFFQSLPLLSWLDLRNNHLTAIPVDIANHQNLENLLLGDNKIVALPNEIGLLPKLKVLQISNNPIVYPNTKIISEGTRSVCAFLKQQYEKAVCPEIIDDKQYFLPEEQKEIRREKEIRLVTDFSRDFLPMKESVDSSLIVKSLSKEKKEGSGIIHKITSTSSNKFLLQSYYDEDKYARASTQTTDSICRIQNPLKQNWVEKLKQLLEEQEKILQQERNLQALSSWRLEKKSEVAQCPNEEFYKPPPPYATDPGYETILTREDMHKEIDRMIQNTGPQPNKEDVEKMISDLVSKLKEMELAYGNSESPRSELEAAGNQIMRIMEIHKQLVQLRRKNNTLLQ